MEIWWELVLHIMPFKKREEKRLTSWWLAISPIHITFWPTINLRLGNGIKETESHASMHIQTVSFAVWSTIYCLNKVDRGASGKTMTENYSTM